MSDIRVYFDRVPGRDQYALHVLRREFNGTNVRLEPDGEWREYLFEDAPKPTLVIDGATWRELKAPLIKALGALPEGAPETEVRVLREWLAAERARVDTFHRDALR